MSENTKEWKGSQNPGELSGTAIFRIGGHHVETTLPSFADFHALCNLFEAAKLVGAAEARNRMAAALRQALGSSS